MIKTKQAFWITVLVYFLVPVLFIVFNYSIDPYGRYQPLASQTILEKLAASSEEVLITEFNYNDRLLLKNYISSTPKPDLVVLGGSRILNIDSDVFTPEAGRVLNAGVTGGTIRDYIGIWQVLKKQNKIPRKILLFLDLQAVYSNSSGIGWYSLSCPFLTFEYGRLKTSKYLKLVSKTYRKKTSFHLESLSSSDVLKKSFQRLKVPRTRSRLALKTTLHSKNAARTPALGLIAPEASTEEKEQAFIDHWGKENGRGESSILSEWGNFSEDAFKELSSLLEDIHAQKSEAVVFLMPSHPLSYGIVEKNPAALANLIIFVKKIEALCSQQGALLYDGLREHHQDISNDDFKDGVHLKKESIDRFLSRAARDLKLRFIAGNS